MEIISLLLKIFRDVVQRPEHPFHKRKIVGSNPTVTIDGFRRIR